MNVYKNLTYTRSKTKSLLLIKYFIILCSLTSVIFLLYFFTMLSNIKENYKSNDNIFLVHNEEEEILLCEAKNDFNSFNNEIGTKDGCYLVPNYVHFIRFGQTEINFVDAVCILAALKHQNPDKIFIHTDVTTFTGKYWELLMNATGFIEKLEIVYMELPREVFGQKLNKGWAKYHGGDVARLRILLKYGGIFLDNDSYIVRSLDEFRKYEMTLGWMEGSSLANQIIITHKNARFLKLWYESYKEYNGSLWFHNAAIKPTMEILQYHPEYIHREKQLIGNDHIYHLIFNHIWPEWRSHYAIHLLIRHQYLLKNISSEATFPVEFNEENIKKYPITFREMVYDVL